MKKTITNYQARQLLDDVISRHNADEMAVMIQALFSHIITDSYEDEEGVVIEFNDRDAKKVERELRIATVSYHRGSGSHEFYDEYKHNDSDY